MILVWLSSVTDTTNCSSLRNKLPKECLPRNQLDWRRNRSGRSIRPNFQNIKTIKSHQNLPWRKSAWPPFLTWDQLASIGLIFWGEQWQAGISQCNSFIIPDLRNCHNHPSWWGRNHKGLKCHHSRRDDSQASPASRMSRQTPELCPANLNRIKWSTSTRSR